MHRLSSGRFAVVTVAVLVAFSVCSVATAAPVPPSDFTCGVVVFDQPCNQTAHFSDIAFEGTPFASAQNCRSFVTARC
jgi:hypothetical protein